MAAQFTQEEWLAIFHQAQKENLSNTAISDYKVPALGSREFAQTIDHTLLRLDVTQVQIDTLCEEAKICDFKSVCVRLEWVDRAVKNLQGSSVAVACVVGFHEGTQPVSDKVKEARDAITLGAMELDMVLNYVHLQEQRYGEVYIDIAAVRNIAPHPVLLKVILETSQLSPTEIVAGCKIAEAVGVDFVKTSTGFNGPGAQAENVRLMKSVVGGREVRVKASGGVKSVKDCLSMMKAGAERIGTSSGVAIMREAKALAEQALLPPDS